jgi:hypothetical protein
MATIRQFHLALKQLKKLALAGNVPQPNFGICFNVSTVFLQGEGDICMPFYIMVDKYSKGWPHHSGNDGYPIAPNNGNHWRGKVGKLRMSLLDWLIEETKPLPKETTP